MSSIERGNLEMLALVVGQDVDLCPKQSFHFSGHTPLTLAAEKGKLEVVKFILNSLSHGEDASISLNECNLNLRDKEGKTALGWAGTKANLNVAQLILHKGEQQFFGISEFRNMLAAQGEASLKGKWTEYFARLQTSLHLIEVLELKSESAIAFEGNRVESQNSGFLSSVDQLKFLMNQRAKEFYYQEHEAKIHHQSQLAAEMKDRIGGVGSSSSNNNAEASTSLGNTHCLSCSEETMWAEPQRLGPAGCACVLCSDCAPSFCDMVVNRDGEDVSRCPGCKEPVYSKYLVEQGVCEADVKKVRNRTVDLVNSQQMGWAFCPTKGCAGGRVVQPQETSAYYSCFLCGHEGCIKCGNEHQGECANYEKEMREFENLLRLGAMAPPAEQPTDPNHPDYMKGRFRPCYHCGVVTERSDGCTHMTCKRCTKNWHWNKGPYNNDYDYNKLPMQFTPLQPPHF